jgi:acyl-CoA reductase-like NAD-dependent aldehyde dehydrogenase
VGLYFRRQSRRLSRLARNKHETRRKLLIKVAEIYERRIEEITQYQVEETSCPEAFARFNVVVLCQQVSEFAGAITEVMRGEIQLWSHRTERIVLHS